MEAFRPMGKMGKGKGKQTEALDDQLPICDSVWDTALSRVCYHLSPFLVRGDDRPKNAKRNGQSLSSIPILMPIPVPIPIIFSTRSQVGLSWVVACFVGLLCGWSDIELHMLMMTSGPVRSWVFWSLVRSWLNLGYRHTRHAVDQVGKLNPRTEGRRNQRSGSSELKWWSNCSSGSKWSDKVMLARGSHYSHTGPRSYKIMDVQVGCKIKYYKTTGCEYSVQSRKYAIFNNVKWNWLSWY